MNKLSIPMAVTFLLAGLLTACNKEFSDVHVEVNASLPIGRALISDSSLFEMANIRNELKINDQQVIYFAIDGTANLLNKQTLNNIFSLQSQIYDFNFTLTKQPIAPRAGQIPLPDGLTRQFYMNISDGYRLDTLILNNGAVNLKLVSGGNDLSGVVCTIPQITRNDQPLVIKDGETIQLDPSYVIAPSTYGDKNNIIEVTLSGTVPLIGALEGEVVIRGADINYTAGYFGSKNVAKSQTTIAPKNLNFNEFTAQAKYAYFVNPSIQLEIGNQIQAPVLITVSTFEIDGNPVLLKNTYMNGKYLINGGEVAKIRIDNATTITGNGFSTALTKDFKSITIGVTAKLNPTAADLGVPSYVAPDMNRFHGTDTLGVYYEVCVPFDCVLEGVKFTQEMDLDLSDLKSDNNTYQELGLRLTGYNQMPMQLQLRPYVTPNNDPKGLRQYLFNDPIMIEPCTSLLKPGTTGFQPFILDPKNPQIKTIEQSAINNVLSAKKLFIELMASTANAQSRIPVKFYSPSELGLDIMIGTKTDINITPSNK